MWLLRNGGRIVIFIILYEETYLIIRDYIMILQGSFALTPKVFHLYNMKIPKILSKLTKKHRIPAKSAKPAEKDVFEVLTGILCFFVSKI